MKYRLGSERWCEDDTVGPSDRFFPRNQLWQIASVLNFTGTSATAVGIIATFVTSGRITIDTDHLEQFMNPFERDPLTVAKERESLVRAIDDLVSFGFLEFAGYSESEGGE